MRPARRPYDIVHLAQTAFPDDPRPRREAMVAAETGRVAIIVLQEGRDPRPVGHYGPIRVVRLPGRRRRGSALGYLAEYFDFLLRARALFRRDPRFGNARIIHVHTLPDFLIAATAPARRRGARVILDLHEIFPEFTRSRFAGLAGRVGGRIARLLEHWSRRRADVVLTVNRSIERLLRGRPSRKGERLEVIHNLTDPEEFGPARLTSGVVDGPLRLVYHGTLTGIYGLDLAIEAVHRAARQGLDVRLDLYGGGPDVAQLAALAQRLGLGERVRLLGSVSHQVLRERLPSYHAGLVPTRLNVMTQYSLSTKLLEYIHLGLPLIASRIPTYLEYFPESSAWYFTPNDSPDAGRAIAEFAAAAPAQRIQRAAGAQAAAAALQWADDARKLRGIYEALLLAQPR